MSKSPYRTAVPDDWIDELGHMNMCYYLQVFMDASDGTFPEFYKPDYISRGKSLVCAEVHIVYKSEALKGDELEVVTQILDVDEKRLHIFQTMKQAVSGELLATAEQMLLHVDLEASKVTPFPGDLGDMLKAKHADDSSLPRPPDAGRSVGKRTRSETSAALPPGN